MSTELRKLSLEDGENVYWMMQQLPADENGFSNPIFGKDYEEYKSWLASNIKSSQMTQVVDGWKVPQTTYWLYENNKPVGIGRIRHFLTEKLLEEGGNISYAIEPSARGRGLGKQLLSLLLTECREMGMGKVLITINKDNLASQKVIHANGGLMEKENKKFIYFWIHL